MQLKKSRFRAILEGVAKNLDGQEILVRNVAYQAERQGRDPRQAVEDDLPFVEFIDDAAQVTSTISPDRFNIPPLQELLQTAQRKNMSGSQTSPSIAATSRAKDAQPQTHIDTDNSERRAVRLYWIAFACFAMIVAWVVLATGSLTLFGLIAFKLVAVTIFGVVVMRLSKSISLVFGALLPTS